MIRTAHLSNNTMNSQTYRYRPTTVQKLSADSAQICWPRAPTGWSPEPEAKFPIENTRSTKQFRSRSARPLTPTIKKHCLSLPHLWESWVDLEMFASNKSGSRPNISGTCDPQYTYLSEFGMDVRGGGHACGPSVPLCPSLPFEERGLSRSKTLIAQKHTSWKKPGFAQ